MSVTAADHIASFLTDRGVERGLRPVWPHQHLPAGGARARRCPALRDDAARAGRRTRGRRLCAGVRQARRRAPPCRAGHDQCRDRRRDGLVRLGPAARHRRRRPVLLRRSRTPPGGQPPSRRRPGLDLRTVREAGMARPSCRPASSDPGPRLGPRRRRSTGSRARVHPHGHPRRGAGRADLARIAGRAAGPVHGHRGGDRDRAPHRPATAAAGRRRDAPGHRRRSPGWRRRSACPWRTRSWAPACCRRTIRSSSASSDSGGRRPRTGWLPRPT